ncbi:hypothetical protein [Staphylococcus saprophyticus]|uniref:hypothetical protein n=1 Tax=Staphylococcus TaxID=1279 RepID=UPI00099033D9|nr:hypothetical protein [Staphylococcus saprophyticus]MDW4434489.1 hypothetical protein [Staphylococcus saprophyticus]OOO72363.1 hypothetical protein B0W56_00305 [Staphylococcus saprophyticus]
MTEENNGYWTPMHVHQKSELDIYKEIHRVERETQEDITELKNGMTELNSSQKEQISRQKEGNEHLKNISEKFSEFTTWSISVDNIISSQGERLSTMETSIEEKAKANSSVIGAAFAAFATIVAAAFAFAAAFFN